MTVTDDERFMARALRLAEKGLYTTQPNPRVGAVIVKDGQIIGEGFHLKAGAAHAEAGALAQAGENARGSTVYCTLEPCSFHGRTPSCARALVDAGVARVVCAMTDPHPKNNGAGYKILEDAGISVDHPFIEASAVELNPGLVKRATHKLPYVRLKLAMSIDGKTALANGDSQWVTSLESRKDVQKLRARSSAIVTGVGTVNNDNPRLTVREEALDVEHAALAAAVKRPIYVLDSNGRIDPGSDLLDNPNTVVVTTSEQDIHGRAHQIELPANREGQVALRPLLEELARLEHNEVLFECGATLGGSLVAGGFVDEVVIYAAPVLLGNDGRGLLKLPKIDKMRDRIQWEIADARPVGGDLRLTLRPGKRAS